MPTLDAESVDAIVCDPPYGLSFMGKNWDHGIPGVAFWREALRVAKPGAHLVAFGGTRTFHRLACAIEDAGWEIRDTLMWLYGSGFPKSLDVSKALDKAAGAEREVVGRYTRPDGSAARDNVIAPKYSGTAYNGGEPGGDGNDGVLTAPATDAAKQWAGWGTALKPGWESIILARKPLSGTVAATVSQYGTGGLNIDGCRLGSVSETYPQRRNARIFTTGSGGQDVPPPTLGRWPANVVLSHSPECNGTCDASCPVRLLDEQSGERKSTGGGRNNGDKYGGGYAPPGVDAIGYGDTGGASRFFLNVSMSRRELLLHRAKAIFEAWNPGFASTANSPSSLSSRLAASALSDAVTLASHGATQLSDLTGLSTSVTATELRLLCEAVIALTLNTASAFSPELQPSRPTPSVSHANGAGTHGPTGTTTITADLSTFGGSAVVATLTATVTSGGAGAKDSAPNRAYYTAKASRREREAGLEGMPQEAKHWDEQSGIHRLNKTAKSGLATNYPRTNHHPTVKPLALMRWLCRLVTPPNGLILDPFAGSGSTGCAAVLEGFRFTGIEQSEEYCEIARRRLAHWATQRPQPELEVA
jgi:DNA modification methylase